MVEDSLQHGERGGAKSEVIFNDLSVIFLLFFILSPHNDGRGLWCGQQEVKCLGSLIFLDLMDTFDLVLRFQRNTVK